MYERSGEDELARRLEAYAAARLSPDHAAAARMRARVLREARFRALPGTGPAALEVSEPVSTPAGLDTGSRPTPLRRRATRRVFAALLAAALALGSVAGVSASSRAGGPLYGMRLWLEEVTLPGDPEAREVAEIARLDARLEEAMAAAATGDQGAVAAALAAYREILGDALAVPGADKDDRLEAALGRHLVVLGAVSGKVPLAAQPGIQNAIENSSKARERLNAADGPGNGGPGNGGPGNGGPGNGGPGNGGPGNGGPGNGGPGNGAQPNPNAEPEPAPDPTPKPRRTPPPRETESPATPEPTDPAAEPEPAEETASPTHKPGSPSQRPKEDTPQQANEGGKPDR